MDKSPIRANNDEYLAMSELGRTQRQYNTLRSNNGNFRISLITLL